VTPVTKNLRIDQTCTVGIENQPLNNNISLYPNPADGLFTISFGNVGNHLGVIGIYDIRGELVAKENVSVNSNTQKTFDLTKAADGIYFVKIQLGNDVLMKKLTLSR
jgi:hypothetical protein